MAETAKQEALPGIEQEAKEYFDSRGERDSSFKEEKAEVKTEEKVEAKEAKSDKVELVDENETEIELDDHGKPKNPGKWIRHGAFHQERERRKAAEAKLIEATTGQARLDERLKLLSEAVSTKQESKEPAAPPNPEEDIFGTAKYLVEGFQSLQKRLDESKTVQERQNAQSQLASFYQADATRFSQQNTDYAEASTHLYNARTSELKMLGYDDSSIQNTLGAEFGQLLQIAATNKRSPAEMVYELAKTRGYAKKAPTNGATPAQDKKVETEAKIDAIAKAQSASKSLSGTGGGTADSLTDLKNMSQHEFNVLYQNIRNDPAKLREYFGS